jgi:hypothetical protein
MASGLAKVEIMRKNIMRKKRMSAKAPVSTSDCSRVRFLKFISLNSRFGSLGIWGIFRLNFKTNYA